MSRFQVASRLLICSRRLSDVSFNTTEISSSHEGPPPSTEINSSHLSTEIISNHERPPLSSSLDDQRVGKLDSVSLPKISLPLSLQKSLDKVLSCYPKKSLVHDGLLMIKYLQNRKPPTILETKQRNRKVSSAKWSETKPHPPQSIQSPLRYGDREAIAYASSRTQAIYGVTLRVLKEIAKLDPDSHPETMLDFGSGLGTAIWAANEVWGESLYEYQSVDVSQEMGELARVLRTDGESQDSDISVPELIPGVYFKQYLPVSNRVQYDIITSAYSLSELPTLSILRQTLASLWRKTKKYLILIEVGSQAGFNVISEARDFILQAKNWTASDEYLEGHVVAPCPHDQSCPITDQNLPCRFAQNVQLSFSQQRTDLHHKGIHSEQFSYVVLKKGSHATTSQSSRLVLPVIKRSRHVICKLCCPNGNLSQVVLTKTKDK